jgi:hypothetical protein
MTARELLVSEAAHNTGTDCRRVEIVLPGFMGGTAMKSRAFGFLAGASAILVLAVIGIALAAAGSFQSTGSMTETRDFTNSGSGWAPGFPSFFTATAAQ